MIDYWAGEYFQNKYWKWIVIYMWNIPMFWLTVWFMYLDDGIDWKTINFIAVISILIFIMMKYKFIPFQK